MQFDYEIPVDEYAAAQGLYYKAYFKRTPMGRVAQYILIGLVFILVAFFRSAEFGQVLLVIAGAFSIYIGISILFQASRFRGAYPQSGLAGKTYSAEVDEGGFSVTGDLCSSQVPWSEVRLKGEDKLVFMLSAKGTIFIFGKKYLTEEQQNWIRQCINNYSSKS